jgi:hypothetical protein
MKKIIFMLLISLLSLSQYSGSCSPVCHPYATDGQLVVGFTCVQFNSWPEIYHLLNGTNLTSVKNLFLIPVESLVLTSEMARNLLGQDFDENVKSDIALQMFRLAGIGLFDLPTNKTTLTSRNYTTKTFNLDLRQSVIKFFVGDRPQSKCACTRDLIQSAHHFQPIHFDFVWRKFEIRRGPDVSVRVRQRKPGVL